MTNEIKREAELEPKPGFWGEIAHYLRVYKKWWLIPMIAVLALFGALVIVAEVVPVVSPFIYTLF